MKNRLKKKREFKQKILKELKNFKNLKTDIKIKEKKLQAINIKKL